MAIIINWIKDECYFSLVIVLILHTNIFVPTDVRDVSVLCKSIILSQKVFATSKVAKFCIKYI